MILEYEKLITSVNEIKESDRTNPFVVASLVAHTLVNYEKNSENFKNMMKELIGPAQEYSPMMQQRIDDRMMQNEKGPYLGKSYFMNATPENDYNLTFPAKIEVTESVNKQEGYKYVELKSNGADSKRVTTLRLAKDGNYYLWSDSYMSLLADIRKPESTNFWA